MSNIYLEKIAEKEEKVNVGKDAAVGAGVLGTLGYLIGQDAGKVKSTSQLRRLSYPKGSTSYRKTRLEVFKNALKAQRKRTEPTKNSNLRRVLSSSERASNVAKGMSKDFKYLANRPKRYALAGAVGGAALGTGLGILDAKKKLKKNDK